MSDNPYAAPQVDPAPKTYSGQSELTSPYGGYRNVGKLRYLILSLLGVGILVTGLVGLWWTAWLITNGSSNYFYRNDNVVFYTTAEATAFNNGIITDDILGIVASLFAAAVIQRLTIGQERMASEYKLLPQ